ncbi:MAG: MBL fold metallo-hydrolase [Candidatus Diapherotrites archaeon]|nr:MBL fold metallo-hydrolase [Candidatus Diapherotrites archaeon]
MIKQVMDNVYSILFNSLEAYAYLINGPEPTLIDAGCLNEFEFEKDLSVVNLTPADIKKILFTHGHYDHFGGAELFPNFESYMHRADGEKINKRDFNLACTKAIIDSDYFPHIDNLLDGGENLYINGLDLEVIHCPGHTPGSVAFYEQSKGLLFSGDTLFNRNQVGRTDLPGGNEEDLWNSVKKLKSLDFKLLLPGHDY